MTPPILLAVGISLPDQLYSVSIIINMAEHINKLFVAVIVLSLFTYL